MSADILQFRSRCENPYRQGSVPWRVWNEAEEATNRKWRLALIGKLPPKEARP